MGTDANWPYKAGEKGRNRVRAFERSSGIIYLEYWERGERERISTGHRDRERAKQQADELAAKFARGQPEDEAGITLRELFDNWLRERTPEVGERQQKHHRRVADLFCRYYGPETEPETLNRADWDRFIRERRAGVIDARGNAVAEPDRVEVGHRTVARDLKTLRSALNWGVQADLLGLNPLDGYPYPQAETPSRPRMSEERYQAMLEVAGEVDWRFKLALTLANETGHRIGAIRHLRWSDVNLSDGAIHWRGGEDKIGYDHETPLTEPALEALRAARREHPAVGEAWVFPSPDEPSEPCSRYLMRDWWYRAERLAGLDHIKGLMWHGLRRKFADEHREVPNRDLAALGGWKRVQTVAEIYQSADMDSMRRAQNRRLTLREGSG